MSSEDAGQDVSQIRAESNEVQTEKMVPQSKVTELVAGARAAAEQKARAELEAQFAKEREQLMAQQGQQSHSMGGMTQGTAGLSEEDVRRLINEDKSKYEQTVAQEAQKREIERLAGSFEKLMDDGPSIHPDFKEVVAKYNPVSKGNAKITLMLGTLDNGNSVLYDMMQNRTKLSHIKSLIADGDDELAFDELKQLSDSIKSNKKAQEEYSSKPNPLSRPRASIAGADSGKKTIKDWKKVWRA